jgi:hypothetical protein
MAPKRRYRRKSVPKGRRKRKCADEDEDEKGSYAPAKYCKPQLVSNVLEFHEFTVHAPFVETLATTPNGGGVSEWWLCSSCCRLKGKI